MKQHVSNSPGQEPEARQRRAWHPASLSQGGVILFLLLICLLLAISARQIWRAWPAGPSSTHSANAKTTATAPLQLPDGSPLSSFQLPAGHTVLYEQPDHITTVTTANASMHVLQTPGYRYNRAVPAIVTSNKELIYSGAGIWRMDLAGGAARQIATIPDDQVITSLTASSDGTTLAWSSAPKNGTGSINIYAGKMEQTNLIYQQSAAKCPCYRAFAFPRNTTSTLLLTNDRGDHRSAHYGLWTLDLSQGKQAQPQSILSDAAQQGPLALSQQTNTLLYSTFQGYVPMQEQNAPADISSLSYANSLSIASLKGAQTRPEKTQTILPEQRDLENTAAYHWIATPQLSADGQRLAYVGFSVNSQKYFPRQYALYLTDLHGSTTAAKQQLVVTSTAHYVELGSWLDEHTLTFYADNALYALDLQDHTVARVANTGAYAHVFAVIE
ncbi:hypothetical protein [Dictyobacter vulcani]|uniref:hypothetical protein n=1 Tax=Dictyobacter vulcani TaxID=2607529 RepID=UPI0012503A5D|nr:hypothetical protein [Dictyobacter vulcani]